jgi:hypothetical protein
MWRKSQVSLFLKIIFKISFVDNPVLQMGFVIQKVESWMGDRCHLSGGKVMLFV